MKNWIVEVLVSVRDKQLDNDTLIAIADVADEQHEWSVARWGLGDGFWVTTDVEAITVAEAADKHYQAVAKWVDWLPLDASVASVRATEIEVFELEADQATVPELVSSVEAGEILRVSRQRVRELLDTRADFPAPLYTLRTGPLWTREAIEAFDKRWVRKAGRPPKPAATQAGSRTATVTPLAAARRVRTLQRDLRAAEKEAASARRAAAKVRKTQMPAAKRRSKA